MNDKLLNVRKLNMSNIFLCFLLLCMLMLLTHINFIYAGTINVGQNQEFTSIQSAINAIGTILPVATPTNPYTIMIYPGTYNESITMKEYVSLVGYGRNSTFITSTNSVINAVRNTTISSLSIIYTGSDGFAVDTGPRDLSNFVINDCYVEALYGSGYLLQSWGYKGLLWNIKVYDTVIKASQIGIETKNWHYISLHNVEIQLVGQNQGQSHIGILVSGGNRIEMFGGHIKSVWQDSEKITGIGDDVYGVYIPQSNDKPPRIHLYNVEIMIRNEDPANVNAIRAEGSNSNGYVRIFSGLYQTEISDNQTLTSPIFVQSNNNIVEIHGAKFRGGGWNTWYSGAIKGFMSDTCTSRLFLGNNVKIGSYTAPVSGAALDIDSATGALVVPRMTQAQRDLITPKNGMVIYNKTTNTFNFYENGVWVVK